MYTADIHIGIKSKCCKQVRIAINEKYIASRGVVLMWIAHAMVSCMGAWNAVPEQYTKASKMFVQVRQD